MKRSAPMRRTPIQSKRSKPRRRSTPQWDQSEWEQGNLILMARAGYVCERCGKADNLERHHRKRRRDGGESFPNLTALCSSCHAWCHAHPTLARKYGWIVSAYMEPVTVPMLWRSRTWVLLLEDGGMVDAFVPLEDAHEIEGAAHPRG